MKSPRGYKLYFDGGLDCLNAFNTTSPRGCDTVALAACGSVHKCELQPGELLMVDNGPLPAYIPYQIGFASRGEGLILCQLEGPGIIYIQS
jgi:uncharacterized protein (AIM24 family)